MEYLRRDESSFFKATEWLENTARTFENTIYAARIYLDGGTWRIVVDVDELPEEKGNPYYSPEKLGLVIVASIDYETEPYQFSMRVVWRHEKTGKLLTAYDTGCSCPTPFEDFDTLDKLEPYNYLTVREEAVNYMLQDGARVDDIREFINSLPKGGD